MKLLYILYFDLYNTEFYGVSKKIKAQVNAMRKLSIEVDIAYCSNGNFIIESENGTRKFVIEKGISNYRYTIYKLLEKYIIKWKYNSVYFRYPGSIEYFFFNTLRLMKKQNIKVFLEMPTYPIGGELWENLNAIRKRGLYLQYILRLAVYSSHILFSRNIHRYIEKIVTFMPYESIWGCRTICIDNGINIDDFKCNYSKQNNDGEIILLGVANIAKWHGFDRVIEGLGKYYQKKNKAIVKFNIVGSGDLIYGMKQRVKELELEDKISATCC